MASVSAQNPKQASARRAVDSDLNMIPMIDLLFCCVAFLLITAVWSTLSRLPTDIPRGQNDSPVTSEPDKVLHIKMQGDESFQLAWKVGQTVVSTTQVPRHQSPLAKDQDTPVRFPELAQQVSTEWTSNGIHRDPGDKSLDRAVLHTPSSIPFEEIVAVIDAVYATKRPVPGVSTPSPAFLVTFAGD